MGVLNPTSRGRSKNNPVEKSKNKTFFLLGLQTLFKTKKIYKVCEPS